MNKIIRKVLLILIVTFGLVGLFCSIFYFPYQTGLYSNPSSLGVWEIIIYWLCSLGCFVLLSQGIIVYLNLKEDIYMDKIIKNIQIGYISLGISSIIFIISNLIFAIIRAAISYEVFYIILGIVGLAISTSLYIFSKYYKELIRIKTENDEII